MCNFTSWNAQYFFFSMEAAVGFPPPAGESFFFTGTLPPPSFVDGDAFHIDFFPADFFSLPQLGKKVPGKKVFGSVLLLFFPFCAARRFTFPYAMRFFDYRVAPVFSAFFQRKSPPFSETQVLFDQPFLTPLVLGGQLFQWTAHFCFNPK